MARRKDLGECVSHGRSVMGRIGVQDLRKESTHCKCERGEKECPQKYEGDFRKGPHQKGGGSRAQRDRLVGGKKVPKVSY